MQQIFCRPPFPHINAFLCFANKCLGGNWVPYRDRASLFASNNSGGAVDAKHDPQCLLIKYIFLIYIFAESRRSAATSLRLISKLLEEQL